MMERTFNQVFSNVLAKNTPMMPEPNPDEAGGAYQEIIKSVLASKVMSPEKREESLLMDCSFRKEDVRHDDIDSRVAALRSSYKKCCKLLGAPDSPDEELLLSSEYLQTMAMKLEFDFD
eukprot:TRINITY_DN24889_c0_g1_i1.p1 TRINITY_DN24889_c0_g1~~TRINITY_DN24889_c0_g1_i1.p1  ORF type:complete len:119 (+),score=26.12 TRINITY_DN24889_c0_g1_i1:208-564(+)